MSEPGNKGAAEQDDPENEDDAPHSPGMLSTSPQAAAEAETAAAAARAKENGRLDAPAVSQDRMKELKTKARAEIQARLTDKRKRRRLLRGNESDSHRTL